MVVKAELPGVVCLALGLAMVFAGCSKKEQPTAKAASAATEVKPQASESLPASAAPTPASSESATRAATVTGAMPGGACCDIVASPTPAARLGRLVIAFPEGANASGSRIDLFKAGESTSIQSGYGAQTWDLIPGTYGVSISGKRLEGVTIQSGHDTQVRVGILRIQAGSGTRVDVMDADGKTRLTGGYGAQIIGLPVGTFQVQIAGQSEAVTIQPGKITDF